MPTSSIIAAVQAKFAALTAALFPAATRPPFYFDELPPVNAAGAQLSAEDGFVVLRDEGQTVTLMGSEWQTLEEERFVFEIYYPSLGDADRAALAIKRNGGAAADALGFDHGALPDLESPRGTFHVLRTLERRSKEGFGGTGKLVHCVRLHYTVTVREAA